MAASGGRRCLLLMHSVVMFLCVSGISMAARPTRHLQSSSRNGNKVLRTDLIHRDHPDSPLSTNASHSERLAACMERSERRRARLLISSTDFQSSINGSQTTGEYVMKISLGTPPQERIAIVDTGSDLVWLQCQCGSNCQMQTDPFFDPTASTSYSAVPCNDNLCATENFLPSCDSSCSYAYTYGDGSTTDGHFVTDTITLTDSTGTVSAIQGFYFGCGQNQTGNFNGADGLIGFGQGAISLPSQMARIYSEVFSYCLVRRSVATTSTSTLQFGSTASSATGLTQTSILSVPANPTFYYVPMVGITVEGVDLGIPASNFAINRTDSTSGVIFDSGTTFTTLDQTSINAIVQKYRTLVTYPELNLTSDGYKLLCYDVSQVASPTFPSMAFQFTAATGTANVDFTLAGENIFIAVDNLGHHQCLAFDVGSDPSIIGNIAMGDHLMEHDLVNSVMGWKQQVC